MMFATQFACTVNAMEHQTDPQMELEEKHQQKKMKVPQRQGLSLGQIPIDYLPLNEFSYFFDHILEAEYPEKYYPQNGSRLGKYRLISKHWRDRVDQWASSQPKLLPVKIGNSYHNKLILESHIVKHLSNFDLSLGHLLYTDQDIFALTKLMQKLMQNSKEIKINISSLSWQGNIWCSAPSTEFNKQNSMPLFTAMENFNFDYLTNFIATKINWSQEAAQKLGEFIGKCTNLEILDLNEGGSVCDPIADYLKQCKNLKSFTLNNTPLKFSQINKFITNLPENLELLDLFKNVGINHQVCATLGNKLPELKNLQLLRLCVKDDCRNGFFHQRCSRLSNYDKTVQNLIKEQKGLDFTSHVLNKAEMDVITQTAIDAFEKKAKALPNLKYYISMPPHDAETCPSCRKNS